MPTTTLTAAAIERLKTPPAGQIEYFDRRLPSFGVGGCTRRGSRVVGLAATGKDPRQIRSEAKQKRQEERRNSFDVCADEFLQKYAERHLRPSTQREYRRILKGKDTRVWRDCPLSAIGKRDVLDVLEEIDARGSPGASKRTLAYLRKFFNWCADRDIITICPTDRIRSPHPEVKRDRVLLEHELNYLLRVPRR